MNKQLKFLTILGTAIITTLGVSITAQAILAEWTGPTMDPPDGNMPAPIYSDYTDAQYIGGALSVHGGLLVNKNPATNNGLVVENGNLILDNGNIGIGVVSPSEKLELNGAAKIISKSGNNAELKIQSNVDNNNYWGIYHDRASDELRFWRSDNRMIITADGKIKMPSQTSSTDSGDTVATKGYVDSTAGGMGNFTVLTNTWSGTGEKKIYCPEGYLRTGCSGGNTGSLRDDYSREIVYAIPEGDNGCKFYASAVPSATFAIYCMGAKNDIKCEYDHVFYNPGGTRFIIESDNTKTTYTCQSDGSWLATDKDCFFEGNYYNIGETRNEYLSSCNPDYYGGCTCYGDDSGCGSYTQVTTSTTNTYTCQQNGSWVITNIVNTPSNKNCFYDASCWPAPIDWSI